MSGNSKDIPQTAKCLECSGRGYCTYWDTIRCQDVLGLFYSQLISKEEICRSCYGKGVINSGK